MQLLNQWRSGDHGAESRLFELLLPDLRKWPGATSLGSGPGKGAELTLAVDALLDELGKESPQQRSVVEMKFFLDLSDEDAAQALNLTLHTFQREWYRARRWLFERLNANPSEPTQGESARGATTA